MRCHECGRSNIKQSKYCGYCGNRLIRYNRVYIFEKARAILWTIIAVFLISAALTISFVRIPNTIDSNMASSDTIQSILNNEGPTLPPVNMEINTLSPSFSPDATPFDQSYGTSETETAFQTPKELLYPVEALKNFILTGSAYHARLALPPEYLSFEVAKYGYAVAILGGADAVIELYGEMALSSLESTYGKITNIDYTVESALIINSKSITEICNHLSEYGMSTMPSNAYKLDIQMEISNSAQVLNKDIELRILLIDQKWYIHPADISL